MAKSENRIAPLLSKRKIDLEGVDLTRARSKTKGVRFLSVAVREALSDAPQVLDMNEAEKASVVAWIEKHVLGKNVSPSALVSACGAAITTLSANAQRVGAPPVPVKAGAVAAAMEKAMVIRKKRSGPRKKKED